MLQANWRFKEIEGKHLALVISVNLFVAVIPLLIIIYAFAEVFTPHRSFGAPVVRDLHLTGSSALIVRDTSASSAKSVALSISLISLLITGLDVSATAQLAYAQAFSMTPLQGVQKYLRGGGWLILEYVAWAGPARPAACRTRGIHRLVILAGGTPRILVQEISEDNQRIGGIFRRLLRRKYSEVL